MNQKTLDEVKGENGILHTLAIYSAYSDDDTVLQICADAADALNLALSEVERLQAENERLEGADVAMEAMQALLDRAVEEINRTCDNCTLGEVVTPGVNLNFEEPDCYEDRNCECANWQWRGFSEREG